jgi:hypothetical protein
VNAIAPEVWARLSNEQVRGETLWARRAAPDVTERLVAALDSDGKRHLLILLAASEGDVEDAQSRGVEVATRELAMPNHASGRYLDITCHDATGHEAFDLIGGELAERLVAGGETAPEIVTRVLSKWRRFWGQSPKQLLSREKQIGLFAEVWFLTYWLIPRFGADAAVARWRGPFGSRHDFEWTGRSIEVKATTATRGHIHRINGLEQLTPPDDGHLFCFSLQLREEAGATNTLPSVIAVCRTLTESHANALSSFEYALSQAEYSPAHESEYAKLKLRVVEQGFYAVRDDFPRLTPTEFPNGLPPGIEHVEYDINLGGFAHLCIARKPAEASAL